MEIPEFTPENIQSLAPNEYVFVGTNPECRHGAGFALLCHQKFGLEKNVCRGLSGQCWGIVTIDLRLGLRSIPLEKIKQQIFDAYEYIREEAPKDTIWYMTKIGTNLAGWSVEDLRTILEELKEFQPKNVVLPNFDL